jgi:protease YdgD
MRCTDFGRRRAHAGKRTLITVTLCLLALLSTVALAGQSLPGIVGSDDRKPIEESGAPWQAIGQVNIGSYRRTERCTGSLVASNIVVTAAHCVIDPWSGKPFPLHEIHFLAGLKGSSFLAHATAKCLHFPPGYAYVGPGRILPDLPVQTVPRAAFLRDMAFIVLNDGLAGIAPMPVDSEANVEGSVSLVHAAYPADRRYQLTGQLGCHLLARDEDLWFTDCDTQPASSGGPVLVQEQDGMQLAAIMVGAIGTTASVAVPIAAFAGLAANASCP